MEYTDDIRGTSHHTIDKYPTRSNEIPMERMTPIFPGRVRHERMPNTNAMSSKPQIKLGPLIQIKSRDDLNRKEIRNGTSTAMSASANAILPVVKLLVFIFFSINLYIHYSDTFLEHCLRYHF